MMEMRTMAMVMTRERWLAWWGFGFASIEARI